MQVSVIIPTYKPQSYFLECIRSIQNQTFSHDQFEVIVVLNGSGESYYSFISSCIEKLKSDISFIILQTDVPGVSNARNIGIDNSNGEYITFIDDDDYISDDYLSELFSIVKETGATPISYLLSFMDGENNYFESYHTTCYERNANKEINSIYKVRDFFQISPCKMLSKEQINGFRFDTDFVNSEDALFMYAVSRNVNRIVFTGKNACYYRRVRANSANFHERTKLNVAMNEVKIIKRMAKYWIKSPIEYNFLFTISKPFALLKRLILG